MANQDKVTPMMAQYLEIKQDHEDALLFYRMGDFYEMFFDDAIHAAAALDIALTKRGKHDGADIPMCGVPAHAAEGYLLTLIRKGFRVAICDQLESPAEAKKRGYKAVVKRGVVRLVTPGTLTEESLLDARRHNYLAAFSRIRDHGALAWVDISTGAFYVTPCADVALGPELARLLPKELITTEDLSEFCWPLCEDTGTSVTTLGKSAFDSAAGEKRLKELYQVGSLEAYGQFDKAEVSAMSAIVEYLDITQKGQLPLLRPPIKEQQQASMQIDGPTRKSLELTQAQNGGRSGSLLYSIDETQTAGGARLLEQRLSSPSCHLATVLERQAAVEHLVKQSNTLSILREHLSSIHDLDRALSRLALDRGGPRDFAAIRNTLAQAGKLFSALDSEMPQGLDRFKQDLIGHDELLSQLEQSLVAEPPLLARDGGFIAKGYHGELDDVRQLRDKGRSVIAQMQADFIDKTGINALKIKHNNVLGYFIETPTSHADKMTAPPHNDTFIHRQTTANQIRFTTVELSELETRILNAGGRALDIEKSLFETLRRAVIAQAAKLSCLAMALANFDVCSTLAQVAITRNWSKPTLDQSRAFDIQGGRHPVVEQALSTAGTPFIKNNCQLTNTPIWLLTGPNMAGKSTFLRQNALITVLAQMGSFVPCGSAHIGIVEQLFSRVGASDDLAKGRSTFMVEMVETAAILNQAGDRALVILDEIGRGTATYDGLSIAWATLEHLHGVNRCRALFATHYHEMSALSESLDGVDNATVTVKEWKGDIIFLHEVKKGSADRSYGVQVASLAGLPPAVISRAKAVLEKLEHGHDGANHKTLAMMDDLPLFSVQPGPTEACGDAPSSSAVELRLEDINPDELSPKEALSLIYELRGLLSE